MRQFLFICFCCITVVNANIESIQKVIDVADVIDSGIDVLDSSSDSFHTINNPPKSHTYNNDIIDAINDVPLLGHITTPLTSLMRIGEGIGKSLQDTIISTSKINLVPTIASSIEKNRMLNQESPYIRQIRDDMHREMIHRREQNLIDMQNSFDRSVHSFQQSMNQRDARQQEIWASMNAL